MTIYTPGDECRVACVETAVCAAASANGGIEKCPIPAEVRARLEQVSQDGRRAEFRIESLIQSATLVVVSNERLEAARPFHALRSHPWCRTHWCPALNRSI